MLSKKQSQTETVNYREQHRKKRRRFPVALKLNGNEGKLGYKPTNYVFTQKMRETLLSNFHLEADFEEK